MSTQENTFGLFPFWRRRRCSIRCGGPKGWEGGETENQDFLTFVLPVPVFAAAAPPKPGGKKPSKRPAWDLKGQLCDLNAELKCCRERTQTLDQENQQLRDQLREAQQQATALGTERRTMEGDLASVRAQAEQGQRELGKLRARVLELEEWLGTQEGLVQELRKEQLELQEERRGLVIRLEEQEVRARLSPNADPPFQVWAKDQSWTTPALCTVPQPCPDSVFLSAPLLPVLTLSSELPQMCVSHTPPCPSFWLSFLIRTALHSFFLLHPFDSLVSTNTTELLAVSQMIQFLLQASCTCASSPLCGTFSLYSILPLVHSCPLGVSLDIFLVSRLDMPRALPILIPGFLFSYLFFYRTLKSLEAGTTLPPPPAPS